MDNSEQSIKIKKDKPHIVCVFGPTASGKTAYAISLAKARGGEIVSCDSMQIYKYMNIGTAKPTAQERAKVLHHMIDFVDPNTDYSVADYVADAKKCIDDILSRNKLPVICGGTGLYADSLISGIEFSEQKRDDEYREKLYKLAEDKGSGYVYELLKKADPIEAKKVHANNLKRVIRALEICKTTGMTKTEADRLAVRESAYDAEMYGLTMPRDILYDRINRRVDKMIADGLEDEVRHLTDIGVRRSSTAMQAIGYKEMLRYTDGECDLQTAVEDIKRESRRYAKRQLTWFKRNKNIKWIEV